MARANIRLRRKAVVPAPDPIDRGTNDGNKNFRGCGAVGHHFTDAAFPGHKFLMIVVDGEVQVAHGVMVRIRPEQAAHSELLVLHLDLIHERGLDFHPSRPWAPIKFGSTFLQSKWSPPLPTEVHIVNPLLGEVRLPIAFR